MWINCHMQRASDAISRCLTAVMKEIKQFSLVCIFFGWVSCFFSSKVCARLTLYRFPPIDQQFQPDTACMSLWGDSKVIEIIFRDATANLQKVFKLLANPSWLDPFTCESADQFVKKAAEKKLFALCHRRVMNNFNLSYSSRSTKYAQTQSHYAIFIVPFFARWKKLIKCKSSLSTAAKKKLKAKGGMREAQKKGEQ